MKEKKQTKFGVPDGNCFQATWASILECEIDDIPDYKTSDWFERYQRWFLEKHSWLLMDIDVNLGLVPNENADYHEIWGKSPRGNFMHGLVGKAGQIVFDVHPDNTGLEVIRGYTFLIPLGQPLNLYLIHNERSDR